MTIYPKGARPIKNQRPRVFLLRDFLQRLNDDVGTTLELIQNYNSNSNIENKRAVGFWSSLRMILPIVESISSIMEVTPQDLLGNDLNIYTPHLTWDLFRHSLSHGDFIRYGKYGENTINWGVSLSGLGHIFSSGYISIDVITLYNDLVSYLRKEISKNDETIVNVEVGLEYDASGAPIQGILDDFLFLNNTYIS